jgi:hypothetical protein
MEFNSVGLTNTLLAIVAIVLLAGLFLAYQIHQKITSDHKEKK